MLVKKMNQAAQEKNIDAQVDATAEAGLNNELESTDVILIGPQVRYLEKKIGEKAAPYNVPVAVIDSIAYGMMDGMKVLEQAIALQKS
ncbi:PTS system, cellobiose-specific IIB component [Salisediminibacterium beveridgei]|uniref:PTS system, cellobiose-specific IIB component n=2 Tax=Salisediminibacterium beveridgei TaxID=632773 RepID=A0A1D7QZI0_9BACI|nr:PTS system, cellobiose-specific IIB component [Salisediminibacterium beveridgei]